MNSILCMVLVICLIGCGFAVEDEKKVVDKKSDDDRKVEAKPVDKKGVVAKPDDEERRRVEKRPVEFPVIEGYNSM